MQRLRQQRDVDRRVLDRQLLELAALPDDVRRRGGGEPSALARSSTTSERSTAITCARPARRLDREIAVAAAEIGDRERRQQQPERARPGRPAPAGHELPRVARVGAT